MPGMYVGDEYDVAGAATGVVPLGIAIMRDVLRDRLGFTGVIMTDDVGAARVGGERCHDLGQGRVLVIDERDESPDGTRRPRPGLLDQDGDVDAAAQAQALGTRMIRASP